MRFSLLLFIYILQIHLSIAFKIIIDYDQIEERISKSNLNAVLLISQYNNCPKCVSAENLIKSMDEYGKHYMTFFILYCDNIPKNFFSEYESKLILENRRTKVHSLVKKKCMSPYLTMKQPDMYLFSPIRIELSKGRILSLPPRISEYEGEYQIQQVATFLESYSSSFIEEIKNETQLNNLITNHSSPTVLSFGDSPQSSFLLKGFSSYFWGKIHFAWVSYSNTEVRNSFLGLGIQSPTSTHMLINGRILNFTASSNYTNFLSFIKNSTGMVLPNPDHVLLENDYQFFSDFCKDCNKLEDYFQNQQQPNPHPKVQNQFFWDLQDNIDNPTLISKKGISYIIEHINEHQFYAQQFKNESQTAAPNTNSTDNCKTEYCELTIQLTQFQDYLNTQNENVDPVNFREEKITRNKFTLFLGQEKFNKWSTLQKTLEVFDQLEFNEVDCRSHECTIWARNTQRSRYIPFAIFESSLTRQPVLIDNSKEVLEIFIQIQNVLDLKQPNLINKLESEEAKNYCNTILQNSKSVCAFYLGKNMPLQFKVLSQLKLQQIIFIQVELPLPNLLERLSAVNESFIFIYSNGHLQWKTHHSPYKEDLREYVQELTEIVQIMSYPIFMLQNLSQLKSNKSLLQVVIRCEKQSECNRLSSVMKEALSQQAYLEYSRIFTDQDGILIQESLTSNIYAKTIYLVIDSSHYTPIYVFSYTNTQQMKKSIQFAQQQLIQALQIQRNYEKIDWN